MSRERRSSAVAAALAAVALAAPSSASAHAVLQQTQPTRGAQLAHAPTQVTLRFNEPVEVQLGAVRVYDSAGREVQQGPTAHPGDRQDTIGVRIRPQLPPGGYTVTYRVISADSHPVSGGLVFTVGHGGRAAESVDAALSGSESGPVTATAFASVRAVQFAAIALALGCWIFVLCCWLPAVRTMATAAPCWTTASTAFARRARRLTLAAAGAGLASAVTGLVLQGATGSGASFWAALNGSILSDVLATRFGRVWGLAALAWTALAAITVIRRTAIPGLQPASLGATGLALPASRASAAVAAPLVPLAALAVLPALSGHAGAEHPTWLTLPANVVHVICISGWLGGIVVMILALRAATGALAGTERSQLLAVTVGRFSTLAGIAFALILASGVAQSLAAIDAWSQLTSTAYGRAVLLKVILFGALVGFGAVQRRRTLPGLHRATGERRSPGKTGQGLLNLLRAELVLGAAVLAITGALATYPPGNAQASGPYSASAVIGPARAQITVDPARVGPDEVHLYLFNRTTGAQYDAIKEMRATASLPSKSVPDLPIDLRKAGPGHYVSTGANFPIAGQWKLAITARVSAFNEYAARIDVPIR